MQVARTSTRRASVASVLIVVGGLGFISAVGVYAAASGTGTETTSTSKPKKPAQPQEIGALIILAGIDAEALAAAGVSSLGCDGVFEAGSAYCLQADRLGQFQLAHSNLNRAQALAMKPPSTGDQSGGDAIPTIAEAQGALDDLRNAAFSFLTTGLDAEQIAKLSKIRANKHWGLSTPYLVVDRTDKEWLALKGALSQQRLCTRTGEELPAAAASVIAAAEQNATVALAKADFASGLVAVKQSWDSHSR